ncbi:family 16 glycosylhydrolase, partial [Candidatus Marinimicrobia bacterium]|nr:family 16 glycosylhydrolase [Candidatus Neomarinimicrobiota bacterium]
MKNIFILLLLFEIIFAQKPYRGAEYRSIETFQYGRFEIRMQSASGSGTVSSFFTIYDY